MGVRAKAGRRTVIADAPGQISRMYDSIKPNISQSLLDFAHQLHGWGANVSAIRKGSKGPLHKWEHLQRERQTIEELNSYKWGGAAAVGVFNGPGGWRVFDIDAIKDASGKPISAVPLAVLTSALVAAGLPDDYQWSYISGSGAGYGFVVRCHDELPEDYPADRGVFRGNPLPGLAYDHLELRWSTGQTVIHGAHPTGPGYTWRKGEPPFVPPAEIPIARIVAAFEAIAELNTEEGAPAAGTVATTLATNGSSVTTSTTGNPIYVKGALKSAVNIISSAPAGDRNNTLLRQSRSIATLVNGGEIDENTAKRELLAAATAAGLTEKESKATIESGFRRAGTEARTAPPPQGQAVGVGIFASMNGSEMDATGQEQGGKKSGKKGGTTGEKKREITKSPVYIKALEEMGYKFRLNELDDTVEVNGEPISDTLRSAIFARMGDRGFTGMSRVEDVYTMDAYNNRYHPIKNYLINLEWDGEEHVGPFLDHLTFSEKDRTARRFFIRWMLGAVGKVFNHDQNFMLVLDGPQDIGKSYLAKWLCPLPNYFIEGAIQPDDKDSTLRLIRHWIWEVGELQSTTRKADREALKNFITMSWATVRRPYGRYDLKKPALASMIGTINESGSGFLDDRTGNRRFAVVNLKSIDWNYTQAIDVNQLWAEIVAAYMGGMSGTMSAEEKREQSMINATYGSLSSVEEYLWSFYEVDRDNDEWRPVREILSMLEVNGLTGNQRANLMELGQILKVKESEGVTKGRPKIDGVKTTSYKGLRKTL